MENFWDSVKLMLFVYALAAVISLLVAGVIKLIFTGIRMREARAGARPGALAEARPEPGQAAPEKIT